MAAAAAAVAVGLALSLDAAASPAPQWLRADAAQVIRRDWPPRGKLSLRYERRKTFTDVVASGTLGCVTCSRPSAAIATWYPFVVLHYVNASRQILVAIPCDRLSACRARLHHLGVE